MLIYIKPLSLFPELHSDTIFGALTSAINELFPDLVEEMIENFENNDPQFLVSSTFPFIKINDKKIKFFPKIITNNESNDYLDYSGLKKFKKIDYIEESLFFDLIEGKVNEKEIINNFDSYVKVGNLLMLNDYPIDIKYGMNILPHNNLNNLNNESKDIFYTSGMEYCENMGLYFYIKILNEKYYPIISAALRFLKDRGFGKDISTGKGQFDYEIVDDDLSNNFGKKFISLSRFIPTDNDLKFISLEGNYEIGSKRGRHRSGDIRKQIRFFKEGSTFNGNERFYGKIIKSGDAKPYIEYGYAFVLRYGGE